MRHTWKVRLPCAGIRLTKRHHRHPELDSGSGRSLGQDLFGGFVGAITRSQPDKREQDNHRILNQVQDDGQQHQRRTLPPLPSAEEGLEPALPLVEGLRSRNRRPRVAHAIPFNVRSVIAIGQRATVAPRCTGKPSNKDISQ